MVKLTLKYLKSILRYNRKTGIFTWLIKPSRRYPIGMVAGSKKPEGHIIIGINGIEYRAHRLAWFYVKGYWPKKEIDHKNRKPSDNRFSNLRKASHAQNIRNRSKAKNNTTGFVGVYWIKRIQKWKAQITLKRKSIHLGIFDNIKEAIKVRRLAAVKYHGEFAH